jgi:hypothetical protein
VVRVALNTSGNRLAGKGSATSFIPKLKNAHPLGNRESFTSASNTASASLEPPSLTDGRIAASVVDLEAKMVLSGHLPVCMKLRYDDGFTNTFVKRRQGMRSANRRLTEPRRFEFGRSGLLDLKRQRRLSGVSL